LQSKLQKQSFVQHNRHTRSRIISHTNDVIRRRRTAV